MIDLDWFWLALRVVIIYGTGDSGIFKITHTQRGSQDFPKVLSTYTQFSAAAKCYFLAMTR